MTGFAPSATVVPIDNNWPPILHVSIFGDATAVAPTGVVLFPKNE